MAVATGLGALPFFFVELDPQWAGICIGMAAGVMLAASFDLIQEGQGHGSGSWLVLGIFIWLCKKVRKNYNKIIWSVGTVHKVILRWRRKGRGSRGFRPQALGAGISMVDAERKEDDYDFLKKCRKQTEDRLQRALARVKQWITMGKHEINIAGF
ncbi:UNVERIFIED_CONTAM: putative zinc transporter [Sesamum latifolium]|uniref:Zinc transporter n=1 Tax=Sesamum latifolium TaxID=2727402 RepID=A0AAW2WCK5_9LAMI